MTPSPRHVLADPERPHILHPLGVAFVASWGIMMTAMMLPSALPMIGLYGATQRSAAAPGPRGVPVVIFAFVYLAVWAAFGAPVYVAHTFLMALPPAAFAYGIAV